ncbi:LysM peptidoglycan-binding domain-containing protein [Paenibacillus radicis (ex Xue et al. 2023)]|uniref:LysM peptidoglycan-binding domain-containing protein n=1 Tax=Paenibacillus radicis (ex Xue et al. 2023) TaxID=2972489 RepID=A0ABT1YG33_9BACL|nr:LysM peptidoglycan-binding domain-containing protein [Paenibacillus radicis (ex Xue et al. 2023)]MCR8631902.1 LysM peptidoglycan-binding domain-containing protein [Paenibacillus radicis (ex Xue et al. 2023)]
MYMNEQLFDRSAGSTNSKPGAYSNSNNSKLSKFFVLLAAVVLVLVFSLCAPMLGGDQDALAASSGSHLKQTFEIEKGDTLWKIANQYAPKGQDVREYMYEIKLLNGLKSNLLQEGQLLQLP